MDEPFKFTIDSAAFIIVDMQNDFVRKNSPLWVEDALKTVNPIKEVISQFRAASRPVIFTRFVAGPQETLLWTWSPQIRPPVNCCKIGFVRYYDDIDAERECIAVVDELAPEPGDPVVDKFGYGAFFRTNLPDILNAHKIDTVVVCGTVTQICVEETAREAFHHGLKTIVLSDCVSSFDPELHQATLRNLDMKFGMVTTSDKLFA
jgi:nicotinamidase-related amidase